MAVLSIAIHNLLRDHGGFSQQIDFCLKKKNEFWFENLISGCRECFNQWLLISLYSDYIHISQHSVFSCLMAMSFLPSLHPAQFVIATQHAEEFVKSYNKERIHSILIHSFRNGAKLHFQPLPR